MTIEEQLANITARLTALERRDIPPVCDLEKEFGIEPIPPICPDPTGEGDSQKAGLSDKIAESVVQDLQQACYDRDELRATVERLKAEKVARREPH